MNATRLEVGVNPGDLAGELTLEEVSDDGQTSRTGAYDDGGASLGGHNARIQW